MEKEERAEEEEKTEERPAEEEEMPPEEDTPTVFSFLRRGRRYYTFAIVLTLLEKWFPFVRERANSFLNLCKNKLRANQNRYKIKMQMLFCIR